MTARRPVRVLFRNDDVNALTPELRGVTQVFWTAESRSPTQSNPVTLPTSASRGYGT